MDQVYAPAHTPPRPKGPRKRRQRTLGPCALRDNDTMDYDSTFKDPLDGTYRVS